MEEIDELRYMSYDSSSFRRKFEFNDLKVQREYGDDHILKLIKELNWEEQDIPTLKLWMCREFFTEKIESLVEKINNNIKFNMEIPTAPTYKMEYLKSKFKDAWELVKKFELLAIEFGKTNNNAREKLYDSCLQLFPILVRTDKYSGEALVKDFFNYSLNYLEKDANDFIDNLKCFSINNILSLVCDETAYEIMKLIKMIINTYPQYLDKKNLERLIKECENSLTKSIVVKRGRPFKKEMDLTLRNIWKGEKLSFDDMLKKLTEPCYIFDYTKGFLMYEKDIYIWKAEPFGSHVKYIRGFLFICNKNGFIDLKGYSRVEISKMFEKTFQLKVNERDMSLHSILKIDEEFYKPFLSFNSI